MNCQMLRAKVNYELCPTTGYEKREDDGRLLVYVWVHLPRYHIHYCMK